MKKPQILALAVLVSAAFHPDAHAQTNPDGTADTGDSHVGMKLLNTESPEAIAKRLQWWSEARFGMFIHWGLYSQDGCFWKGRDGLSEHMMLKLRIPISEYATLAEAFNPVKFDADEWVRVAKYAGMKYVVLTSKHHDGFAMYDSPCNAYNIVKATPFKRDPVKELAVACRKQGLRFGVYYSLGRDWHDPDVPTDFKPDGVRRSNTWDFPDEDKKDFAKYHERKLKPQIRELLAQYGPIDVMWFDTPEKNTAAQSKELLDMIRQLQPACIVNARLGHRLGDYTVEEQTIPVDGNPLPWESCMTLNRHWGFHQTDNDWKPGSELIRNLIDIASKGGNFLLNVGPTGEGVIPAPSVERLKEVGAWMKINGEAICGSGPSPFGDKHTTLSATEKAPDGTPKILPTWDWRCTRKAGKLFITLFDWPKNGRFEVPAIQDKVSKVYLLAGAEKLMFTQTDAGIALDLPAEAPDKTASVICLEFAKPGGKVTYDRAADAKRMAAMSPEELAWEKTLEENLGDFYFPHYKADKLAGKITAWDFVKDDPTLPRVLLIGDSISRGYTHPVRELLEGVVNVHRAPANCGATTQGVKKLNDWLGSGKWDVIHFNFGIHDRNLPLETYAGNLEKIVLALEKTGAKLIWARTTPPANAENAENFSPEQCRELNRVADEIMTRHGIPTNDLCTPIQGRLAEVQTKNNVHFSDAGYKILAKQVTEAITERLKAPVK